MILINVIAVSYTHLIEKTHGDRFGQLAKWIENNELYSSTSSIQWMCPVSYTHLDVYKRQHLRLMD